MKTAYVLSPSVAGQPVSLTNDGALEVIPIGVGSMLARTHFNTNFLVVKGGTHLVIDFGRTGPEALSAIGLSANDVTNVLPTHAHDDHVGGIGTLATANRYVGQKFMGKPKLTMVAPRQFAVPLWEKSLRGNLSMNEFRADGTLMEFSDWFDLAEPHAVFNDCMEGRDTYAMDFHGIGLELFRTMHVPDTAHGWKDSAWSVGVRLDGRVFISGDTRFDPELVELYSHGADLVFHDVSLTPNGAHASLDELRMLPDVIKSKIHLIHYADAFASKDIADFGGWAVQGARYVLS